MNAILVEVGDVVANKSPQMLVIQWNYMIQQFSSAAPYPALRDSVLPGTPDARPFGLQTCRLQKLQDTAIELRIAIQDDVAVRPCFGEGFTQLLGGFLMWCRQ